MIVPLSAARTPRSACRNRQRFGEHPERIDENTGVDGSARATRWSSTALSVPNDDTTAVSPSVPSANSVRNIVSVSTPANRALRRSASA